MNDAAAATRQAAIPRALLIAGLAVGVVAAAAGLLGGGLADAVPPQAVALVNQRPILRDTWLRAVAAVASERRTPLTDADQRHILDRLVDEELLVQQGLALGLAEQDGRIRSELVQQVMRTATAGAAEPDDAALRRFYDDNRDFFAVPARLRVAAARVQPDGSRAAFSPPVPDTLLPPATLERYLGPALTAKALALASGETAVAGDVELHVAESQPGAAPPYEQVREQVRAESRRRADEAAVRALVADLRRTNKVVMIERP